MHSTGQSWAKTLVHFRDRQTQVFHFTQRYPQHCQPLVNAGLGTGTCLQCQTCERSPSENSTSILLPEYPSHPQTSAASTTQIFKTGQQRGPAAFSSLLTFAEFLFFTLILQLLHFLPHHYQFFFSVSFYSLFNRVFSFDWWKSGITWTKH